MSTHNICSLGEKEEMSMNINWKQCLYGAYMVLDLGIVCRTLPAGKLESCRSFFLTIVTKTCLYNFDPLKPHFYIVKLGFTGVYIIFLMSAQKH